MHVFCFDLLINLTGHIFFLVESIKYNSGKTISFLLVKMKARLMLKEQKKLHYKLLFIYLFC